MAGVKNRSTLAITSHFSEAQLIRVDCLVSLDLFCSDLRQFSVMADSVQIHFGRMVEGRLPSCSFNPESCISPQPIRDALLPRLISGELRVGEASQMGEAAVRGPAGR